MSTTPSSEMPSQPSSAQPFQAEVARLLHLMVHAVYTDKEIFLRELISNASDACDKLRYAAISQDGLLGEDQRLSIRIVPEAASGTLVIADNGIGMDRQELVDNLGTIARSGTRAFLDKLAEAPDGIGQIGQFGVGFYAAFMVADAITVTSRKAGGGEASVWESQGADGFSVRAATEAEAAAVPRGTRVALKLKDDCKTYLEPHTIERIVRTYSDHILFPVELVAPQMADGKIDETKPAEPRQINSASALWQRSKSEVSENDYTEAYRTISGGFDAPRLTIHYKAEGRQSYAVLLFVPTERPFDIYDPERRGRVKLYVRRVYITDDAELLPTWLRFVRGVVDSEDVPLNISREMLQNNPLVAQIRKALTGRVLNELQAFASRDAEGYAAFWETFGAILKEGLYEDFERREDILKLVRLRSTAGEGWRSLSDYVADMKPNQTEIYYLAGDSLDRLKASPQLEAARQRGIEVALLTDPVDSFWTTARPDFEGKPLRSLSQGDVDLSLVPLIEQGEDTNKSQTQAADGAALIPALKTALGDAVSDVRESKRLVSSAVCLVAPGQGPDLELERLLQRQDRGVGMKPVLEVNTGHPLVAAIAERMAGAGAETVADLAQLLLDQARILEGEAPPDPRAFTERMNRLVLKGLSGA